MKILKKMKEIINKTETIVFPHYSCVFCGRETLNGEVCNNCKQHFIKPKYCEICGEHISDNENICIECKEHRDFDRNWSVVEYNEITSRAIIKLKFKGAKYLAEDFANILVAKFKEINEHIDIVCAVPSHSKRIKERGYNQAEEIAKSFCAKTGLTYATLIKKDKDTAHQTGLSKADRLKNLKDSFSIADDWLTKGRNVLIIDDVFTTGSTISACAQILKKHKVNKVFSLTVAKTAIKYD